MKHSELYQRLSEEIHRIKLIDSHCHIIPFNDLAGKMDVFKLFALYNAYALLSSGMSVQKHELLEEHTVDLEKKWETFHPYWKRIKNTACAKIFLRAMDDLFGYRSFEAKTYKDFSNTLSQVYAAENTQWYREVLKEKAGIALGIIDYGTTEVNREFFVPSYRFENRRAPACDHFITVRTRDELERIEEHYDTNIVCLDDFLELYTQVFSKRVEEGIVAIKLLLGYLRTLDFSLVTREEAERVFNQIFLRYKPNPGFLHHQEEGPAWKEAKILQDYMVHQTFRHALKHKLPVQIHAGYQAGRRNRIAFADPKLLNHLFIHYKNLDFIIMHSALPYTYDAAVMIKNFPNVFMEFSWTNQLAPSIYARVIGELIEFLPAHKLIAFGSDNAVVEGAYAEAREARKRLAAVFTQKVEEGYFTEEEAVETAEQILKKSAISVFKLTL